MLTEFAGYALPDDGTPFPGGTTYATTHPTLGTPVTLRRVRAEWLAPADTVDAFVARLRTYFAASQVHLARLVDAGVVDGQPYAVTEAFAGTSLEQLVKDIGPMPTFLAADYARQTALALDALHDRGLVHGDVRPVHVQVGPLVATTKKRADGSTIHRPGPQAKAMLDGAGLTPLRPSGREWAAFDPLATKVLAFLPPERVDAAAMTVAGDLYGLGATLFYLLTGRAPFVANAAADVVQQIASQAPAPLGTLRPDLPVGLVDLVQKLLAKSPAERPASATDVAGQLAPFAEPEPVALTAAPPDVPPEEVAPANEWAPAEYANDAFAAAHSDAAAAPVEKKKSTMTDADRSKLKTWFIIGGVFWGVALILWLVLLNQSGCLGSGSSEPKPKVEEPKKKSRR